MKNAAETTPDVIPPVHVLEAAQQQDRKETEDLLAGFDRPGRSPRRVPSGDFVDYYARKKSDPARGPSVPAAKPSGGRRDAETVIISRKKETPAWVLWIGAAAVLLTLGASLAYVATSDAPVKQPPSAPSAATTITSAWPTPPPTSNIVADVPPPDPAPTATANPTVVTADPVATTPTTPTPPRAQPKPRASASAQVTAPPETSASPPPSNGYIRTFPTP